MMLDPPTERLPDPLEQAARDMEFAAFLGVFIKVVIVLAAAIALIFVWGP